jgi:hypothetical protein
MALIECPNCTREFSEGSPALRDGAFFTCPYCQAEVTITMTWTIPPGQQRKLPPVQHMPLRAA